jgi:uncharacterized protein YabN with tetrapyrrole methylase and pyrophosphatase domain
LRHTTKKFIARFNYIEEELRRRGAHWGEYALEELDQLWEQAKNQERLTE